MPGMPRTLRAVFLTVIALLAAASPAAAAVPNGPSPDLVISEVYGAGGNAGSDYPADYVELFNRGTETVSLDGRSLQYASAAGTGAFSGITELSGDVAPGQYVLVQAPGGTVAGDITLVAAMAATAGKVALAEGTSSLGCNTAASCAANGADARIIDLVGFGATATYFEGAGPALGASTTMSTKRNGEGCAETDDNAGDFAAADQDPDNRATTPAPCGGPPPGDAAPRVTATSPSNGAVEADRDGNVTVTFSEPVDAGEGAFTLSCGGSAVGFALSTNAEGTVYTLDPDERLPRDTECTLTVLAEGVTDRDTDDPPDNPDEDHTATFRTSSAVEGLRIHDIQGRQHLSPYRDRFVAGVPGIVTARRFNGLYIQDPRPDRDERTSEGIFIFTSPPPAAATIGAAVTVSGRVTEFRQGCTPSCTPPDFESGEFGASAFANLTITEIDRATVTVAGTGAIAPTVIGRGGRVPPRTVIDDDTPDPEADDPPLITGNVEDKSSAPGDTANQDPTFDPREDGIDFYESLEGMLTRVNRAVVVEPANNFSVGFANENTEVAVLADNGEDATIRSSRGPIVARAFDRTVPQEYRRGDFNPERLILNDPVLRDAVSGDNDSLPEDAEVGDRFTTPVDAVVDYAFGNYKLYNRDAEAIAQTKLKPETAPSAKRDELSVASYNVENLDPVNDAERIGLIATQIRKNLRAPDILGIQEVQDNDGEGPAGPNGDLSWQALVDALAEQGVTYEYRQIDPVHNADGGAPGANIRVGFLFRPTSVDFVDRPGGTATNGTQDDPAQRGAQLTFSPGRVEPQDPAWENSRKPLAGEFRYRGKKLFVVVNHLASKGGDAPLFGRFQEPYRPSELQRRDQAAVLNDWIERLQDAERDVRVITVGDFNDFQFSETSRVIERGEPGTGVEMVNLWRSVPEREQYSYIFQGTAQVLDHIFVSPSLLRETSHFDGVHINSEFAEEQQSDHDPPLARLSFSRHGHGSRSGR